ncbi:MAG: hypothetical protein K6C14_00350 [Eubacterium sp.]|nr:hypothetical protein [Eubacterium sp.]
MKIVKRITKSIIASLMALLMLFSVPSAVYAYIGAIVPNDVGTTHSTFKAGTETYAYLENDYIHFDICIASTNPANQMAMVGSKAHTVPRATMPSDKTKLDAQGVQYLRYMKAGAKVDTTGYELLPDTFSGFSVSRVDVRYNATDSFKMYEEDENPYTVSGELALKYWLVGEGSTYTLNSYFSLVKLNGGDTQATEFDEVKIDPNDDSVNWGVRCVSVLTSTKEMAMGDGDMYGNVSPVTFYRLEVDFQNFAKTGHESITATQLKDIPVNAQTCNIYNGLVSRTVISNGVSATEPDTVLEVNCDSYGFASPFVAASRNYYYSMAGGVEGHDNYYAASVSYANNTLTTYGESEPAYIQRYSDYYQKLAAVSSSLWGYRNLSTQEEAQQQQIQPDKFDMKGDAQYLAVFPDKVQSGKQLYKVVPLADTNAITSYEKANGIKSVAQYRGQYLVETNKDGSVKYYRFNAGVAALSPSITANWDAANGYFRLKPDGTLEFDQSRISLNSPTFKFYTPKDGGGLTFDGYDSKLGVKFGINPNKNGAYINIDIPGNGVSVKGASVDTTGNLVFTGKFKINLFVAQMEMLKLGYGLNTKSQFVCNGVHAKGKLKVPSIPGKDDDEDEKDAKPNVLGFGGASMEGEVNTFKGEELYDFKFELTVKNLFKTQAQLTLVRLKNGRLCPEKLSFELNMTNGVGIDLTPATPAVTITGGGGGISGLASTIDGNYTCIPPVVLTLSTTGQVVKVIDGKLTAKIGPSMLRLIGTDVGLKVGPSTLKVIDRAEAGIYLTGKEITYGTKTIPTKTYRGVTFGGDIGLGIKIFNFKDGDPDPLSGPLSFFNNTISADFGLGLETYAGGATDGSDWMYMYIGTYGLAACSLNFPAGIPGIGGKSILGASLQFKIIAQSAFPEGSVSDFFKNAKLAGAIVAEGHALGIVHGRITYILPKTVKFTGRLFKDLDEVNWDDIIINSEGQNAGVTTVALGEPEVVELPDGEEAVAFASANIAPVQTRVHNASYNPTLNEYSQSVRVNTSGIADGEDLILAVVPKDADDIDMLEDSISCNKITTLKRLPEVMNNGDDTTGYNYWVGPFSYKDDGSVDKEAVFLSVSKEKAAELSGVTTVKAAVDFDIHGLATTPVTGLNASITNDTVSAEIENPEDGKDYTLYTYFGKKTVNEKGEEQVTTDYIVEGQPITNVNGVQIVTLNRSGNVAPTDDYYVTTALVEKTTVTAEKEDGTTESEEVEIPVASWVSPSTYHYVNTTVPTAPTNATLELIGNESMKASWKKANNADGYKLTIYEQNGSEWVDTERGFNLTNEDFASTQGLAYDEATETYSIEIAMTVGGDGEEATLTNGNGKTVTISKEAAQGIKALEAGKTYKVGVQAYKTNSITLDGEETSYDEYSEEAQTGALLLPVYKPVTFDVSIGGIEIEPVDGIYNATVNNDGFAVTVKNAKDGNTDVSSDTVITVSQTGFTDSEGKDYSLPLDEIEPGVFRIPDFEGTISLEISAKYTHDGVTDETLAYLYVNKDNVAPVISLDEDTFYADKDGNYTVTGTTEPGAEVELNVNKTTMHTDTYHNDETGEDETTEYLAVDVLTFNVTADSEGAFSFSENLGTDTSTMVSAFAKDENQNESEKVSTIITPVINISNATVSGVIDKTYTGEAITQDFVITLDDGTVLSEDSYDVDYTNNVNAGTASYKITCRGVYEGEFTGTFKINRSDISKAVISGVTNKVYTGKPFTQNISVTLGGKLLPASAYTVSYNNNVNAGSASVIITGAGNYTGTALKRFAIAKAKNTLTAKAKKVNLKLAKLKKKNLTVKRAKAITVKNAKGKLSFKKAKGNKNITVNKKTGKITVKKALKKGTYKVKIKVTAAGNANYNKLTKTITVKFTVK